MIPDLQTERLILRGWKMEDFSTFASYSADVDLNQFRGGARSPQTAWDEFSAMIGHWNLRGFGNFALEEKKSNQVAGYAGLWLPPDLPEPELGWGLYRKFHGHGYATEAARAVQAWAQKSLGFPPLMSFIHPENTASQRVAERLGAEQEGRGELRGEPRLIYRHRIPETPNTTSKNQTSKKEIQACQ